MTTQEILKHANDISIEDVKDGIARNKFCDIWPTAKQGLEMLKELTKNPIVKSVISVVIAGGDAVSSKIC